MLAKEPIPCVMQCVAELNHHDKKDEQQFILPWFIGNFDFKQTFRLVFDMMSKYVPFSDLCCGNTHRALLWKRCL